MAFVILADLEHRHILCINETLNTCLIQLRCTPRSSTLSHVHIHRGIGNDLITQQHILRPSYLIRPKSKFILHKESTENGLQDKSCEEATGTCIPTQTEVHACSTGVDKLGLSFVPIDVAECIESGRVGDVLGIHADGSRCHANMGTLWKSEAIRED
ncbi:unnamed protein product [Aspergillus oryzae var. brunneus]|uniref:Unnamed protein product n=1 Tax=Aspergillus oryzae var. brunneus TaxID=332754 RepID=A0ABQ6KNE9_ASPOZ|nr:unnamed protein product [Aspergillus oryzae var. brunneus]